MEWQLPIQKVELGNINIGNPWSREKGYNQKPMAPLSYFSQQFRMPFITLLFPPLPIIEYNRDTGKLVLDMSSTNLACIKLNTFQETLVNAIQYHQQAWFKTDFTKEEIRSGFQQIIEGQQVVLYCPPSVKNISVYKDGWKSFSSDELTPGTRIRIATKIHGISFMMKTDDKWSGKCRLQHRIQGILFQND